ncbi:phenylpropionate dioxygenase-like ring-hydroxylating dioxygenase large terminal subunit [Sinorhizobium fredii]
MSAIIDKARDLDHLLATAVQDDMEAGIFRCRRDIFTNGDLFELEMKHIFESNWVYLAHESQIPENNDYYTTSIGRQPVVVTRDKNGELHAVINACAHRGAMLCRRKHGNKGSFTCPFHGWTFSNAGKLLQGQGREIHPVSAAVRQGRLSRPEARAAVRKLSRLPVRQPQGGRADA